MKKYDIFAYAALFIITMGFICIYAADTTAVGKADTLAATETTPVVSSGKKAIKITNHFSRKIKISGMSAIECGEFVAGHHKEESFAYPVWNNKFYGRFRLESDVGERLHIILEPQLKLYSNTYPIVDLTGTNRKTEPFKLYPSISLENAQGILNIGDIKDPYMQIAAGIMHYKYNNEAYNLGEYMFRTGTHPAYVMTSFDVNYAILPGLRVSLLPIKDLYIDALLTTETMIHPIGDWSLSFLAGYKAGKIIDVGAGIDFDRLFNVSPSSISSPHNAQNKYTSNTGETKYYEFGGTKLMGRISLDPKSLLPEWLTSFMGKEDGKIYSEVAILGIKNVSSYMKSISGQDTSFVVDTSANNYYSKLSDRIPIMVGVNIPCFEILDVVSLQTEYYSWPYTDMYFDQEFSSENPIPKSAQSYSSFDFKHDSWKWSVYAKKTLGNGFSVTAQFARDHTHHDIYNESQRDEQEVFTRNNEWGWWTKIQYNF